MIRTFARGFSLAWVVLAAAAGQAQPGFEDLPGFGNTSAKPRTTMPVTLDAQFTTPTATAPGALFITATIEPGWHVYSLTQRSSGGLPTVITVANGETHEPVLPSAFASHPAPAVHYDELVKDGPLEEHVNKVTWYAPLALRPEVDPRQTVIAGTVRLQACAKQCLPFELPFAARLGPGVDVPREQFGEYRHPRSHVVIRGALQAAPDGRGVFVQLSAEPQPEWHLYALADRDPHQLGSKPTLIHISPPRGWSMPAPFQADKGPVERYAPEIGSGKVLYYEGSVAWTGSLVAPPGSPDGEYPLVGLLGYMACEKSCDPPAAARFAGSVTIRNDRVTAVSPLLFSEAKYDEVALLAANSSPTEAGKPAGDDGWWAHLGAAAAPYLERQIGALPVWVILSAIAGGFILNFMPCVLPVLGLKIMSFVQQAGQSRARIIALNGAHTLGVLSIFMVLATLVWLFNLSWGQQNQSTQFNVAVVGLIFAMALSFLGVWEIPIPGFATGSAAADLAGREGATGAFFKGAITTVLSVPCSGPFLGAVFGALTGKPAGVIYAVFALVGLGMSLPYLLIGAFPKLVRLLPKPGAWMDTFKHLMGFMLLGFVAWVFTYLDPKYTGSTFAMLVGLWAGLWWIGRIEVGSDPLVRMRGWAGGLGFAAIVGVLGFLYMARSSKELAEYDGTNAARSSANDAPGELDWRRFSTSSLELATQQGRTVLLDFTAEWCLNCKANSKYAINTPAVKEWVEANGVVALLADWTHPDDEIKTFLNNRLQSQSIPVLAIYPAGDPQHPIILRDIVTESQVLDALRRAGKSRGTPGDMATRSVSSK